MAQKTIDLVINFLTGRAKKDAQDLLKVTEDVEGSLEAISDTTLDVDTQKAERALEDVTEAAQAVADVDPQIVVEVDPGRLEKAKDALRDVAREAEDAGDKARLSGESTVTAVADLTGPLGDVSSGFSDFGGAAISAAELASSALGLTEAQAAKLAGFLGPAGLAVVAAAGFWGLMNQGAADAKKRLEEVLGVQESIAAGQFGAAAAELSKQVAPFSELFKGLGVSAEQGVQFVTGQIDALGSLTAEGQGSAQVLELVQEVQDRLNVSYEEARKIVFGNLSAVRDLREEYLKANGTLEDQQKAQFEVLKGLGATTDAYLELAKSAVPSVRNEILKYIGTTEKIPTDILTRILADTDADNIAQVEKALDELAAGREVSLQVRTTRPEGSGPISGIARDQVPDGGGSGSFGATYNTTINVDARGVTDPKSVAKEIDGQLRFGVGARARAS